MLVLSRQRDETIMIGDDIEVTVVDIRGDKVRLGINAPKEISVHRKEVYDAIRRENRAAARFSRRMASYTSLRWTLISLGALIPRRTLSPRISTTVTSMLSPIMIVSSRCLDSTNISGSFLGKGPKRNEVSQS